MVCIWWAGMGHFYTLLRHKLTYMRVWTPRYDICQRDHKAYRRYPFSSKRNAKTIQETYDFIIAGVTNSLPFRQNKHLPTAPYQGGA